jgi:basic membrane lipoprotein Med (substrate-binding protein (PBP1-ABC) superfamily)/DNA-binding SARP family transcriptional activator
MRSLEEAGGCTVEFRILGPLEVVEDAELLDVGPHKQRSLLAILLLNANRVVTTDHLLEELWGDEAEGKENALWVYVSRLRAVLEPGREKGSHPQVLVTRDHGYQLVVDPESIDSHRFERTVEEARSLLKDDPSTASGMLREALAMWRGSALQDFAYDDFAQPEIVRLGELRLDALEDAVEADLRAGKAGELIGELEQLHEQHPMRERPVAQLMLAMYRAGRSADALRAFERFRRTIGEEIGIDPSPELCRLEEQVLLHDSRLQPRRPTPKPVAVTGPAVNPFRGLRPFSEDDAGDFFGRDRLIAEVVRRIDEGDRLIAMVGPSGSGKSSAVRAGLIPSIRKGAVAGSDQWLIAQMLPGSDPFIELEAALLRSTIDAPDGLREALQSEDGSGLLRAALRLLPAEGSRLLLVVDQFEELFTLVEDGAERIRFLDQLVGAVDDTYGRVVVIVTLRADFYGRPLEHSDFGTRMGTGVVNVVPLTSDELEDAALEPARRSGVTLEPALLAELISDVLGQPGALPMFQYTLTELFDRRVGDVLTVDTYRTIGGVQGSLTKSAEELYEQLDSPEREVVKQLFLRLVTIAEHDEWSRRRVHAAELIALDVDVVTLQTVIESFTKRRLLSLDRDQVTSNATVEVAHEALLSGWERLREWIEQNRDDLVRHRELATAADRWKASGRDGDYLYAGGRLDSTQRWSLETAITLTDGEREFLDAGLERRREEEDRERERIAEQQRLERTARWRTRGMAAAVAVMVVVIAGVVWAVTRPEGPKIGLVYLGEDQGTVQALIADGWEQAQREFHFEAATVEPLIDSGEDIDSLAEAGYELIISGLFDDGEEAYEMAEQYPDTHFVQIDGEESSLENVTTFDFARDKAAYLVGAAAALKSQTGRIGFIGGAQQDSTERRRAAYTAGARSINPNIVVDAVYLGPYHDPNTGAFLDVEAGRATAAAMYRSGVDVIHHSAGEAARELGEVAAEVTAETGRDCWVIGSEIDERRRTAPAYQDRFLTSMWKRWDLVVVDAVSRYLEGELLPGKYWLGIEEGYVDYSTEGGNLSPAHLERLEEIRADILAGSVVPPVVSAESPRWTREPQAKATLTFDGQTCMTGARLVEVASGDVVQVNITNQSDHVVEVRTAWTEEDGTAAVWTSGEANPWTAGEAQPIRLGTLTAPGATNGVSGRFGTGTFLMDCFVGGTALPGLVITARFETTCQGPPVGSEDPIDLIRALEDAVDTRDPDAVCSLLSDDATAEVFFGIDGEPFVIQGNEQIAEAMTEEDDNLWLQSIESVDIEPAEDSVSWRSVWSTYTGPIERCHTAEVDNGKIVKWQVRPCPEDD